MLTPAALSDLAGAGSMGPGRRLPRSKFTRRRLICRLYISQSKHRARSLSRDVQARQST